MKKLILTALVFLISVNLKAQESQNVADLDFLYQSIQKLPSYKDQLKNDNGYRQLYDRLRKELNTSDEFEVYQKLLQLIYPLKDNHLGLWRKPDSSYKFSYLKPELDLTQLETKYADYPKDSLEGFYYNLNGSAKSIIYKSSENTYHLQNLTTKKVEAILTKTGNESFDAIKFLPSPGSYLLYRNVKLSNRALIGLNYQKGSKQNFANLNTGALPYEYRKLEDQIGYLRLSNFRSSNENIKVATDFFDKVRPGINSQNLIVDLRNNGGGGYKTSSQFIEFLKKYKGKIYILQNAYTMSNAEQFIINLQGAKNVVTLGETTKGTITYGSNQGNPLSLPSGRFVFYPTDMSGRAKDLAFESVGVKPQVLLDAFSGDWITQTINYIKTNHP